MQKLFVRRLPTRKSGVALYKRTGSFATFVVAMVVTPAGSAHTRLTSGMSKMTTSVRTISRVAMTSHVAIVTELASI